MRYRVDRLETEIMKEIGQIIIQDINDPRLSDITITGVDLSKDLKNAKIYYSFMGHLASKAEKIEKALNQAKKRIRFLLSKKIIIRRVPEIEFVRDESLDYAEKIGRIINDLETQSRGKND